MRQNPYIFVATDAAATVAAVPSAPRIASLPVGLDPDTCAD